MHLKASLCASPGEGGALPAFSSAGGGRVRGWFREKTPHPLSPENRRTHVIPAQAGIQFFRTWTPACAGVTKLIFISSGGPEAHGNSSG